MLNLVVRKVIVWLYKVKSKLEQKEIAYKNNEAKIFYQEVSSIRKGFNPQTLLIRNKTGHIISNKENHAKVA
jgi:hypothetical protein